LGGRREGKGEDGAGYPWGIAGDKSTTVPRTCLIDSPPGFADRYSDTGFIDSWDTRIHGYMDTWIHGYIDT